MIVLFEILKLVGIALIVVGIPALICEMKGK